MQRDFPSLIALLMLAMAGTAEAREGKLETYLLDPVHTQIIAAVDHLGLSNGIGRLKISEGWFQFDREDWTRSRVDVSIDIATLDMGDAKWTETVLSNQFLDVKHWPRARFVSESVEKTSDNKGVIRGQLSWRGKTRPVTLDVTFNRIRNDPYTFRQKAGFSATARFERSDFGMQRYQDAVGASVELRIEVEGTLTNKPTPEQEKHVTEEH